MTINKSLSILGLTNNYTESELKKAYHRLSKLNHPDYHANESQEELDKYTKITQNINEAYKVLKDNLKNRKGNNNNQTSREPNLDIDNLRKIAKEKINIYYKKCDATKLMTQVRNLIYKYEKIIDNETDFITIYNNFIKNLELLYKDYIDIYAKKYKIPKFIIFKYIKSLNCSCDVIYNYLQLSLTKIDTDIDNILKEYQNKEYYLILKDNINSILSELKNKLSDVNITEIEYNKLKKEYFNKINMLYLEYSIKYIKFMQKYNKIKDMLSQEQTKKIEQDLKDIVKKLKYEEIDLYFRDITITQLNENINSDINKLIKNIYDQLRKKYLQNCDKEYASELFMEACDIIFYFQKKGNLPVKLLTQIIGLTFQKPEDELLILKRIKTKLIINNNLYNFKTENCKININNNYIEKEKDPINKRR